MKIFDGRGEDAQQIATLAGDWKRSDCFFFAKDD
jgi:hypothetical protein